jgi:hypothetical protein
MVFGNGKGGIMRFDRVYPQDQFKDDRSEIEITININCPHCKPEDTIPENYQDKQEPLESDILFPPRLQ